LIKCLTNIEKTKIWTRENILFSVNHWFGCGIVSIKFTINAVVSAKTVNQLRLISKSSVSAVPCDCCIASAGNYWWVTGESLGVECAINNIVEEAGVVSLWKSRGLKSNIVVVLEDFVTSFEREVVSILQCLEVEV